MRIALVAVVLIIASCTRPVEVPVAETRVKPRASFPVRTDRSAYRLTMGARGPEATIVTTIRAPQDRSIYIMNCNGAVGVNLQRKIGEKWEYAWIIAMNACLSPPIVVPPGGEHTVSIYIHQNAGAVLPREPLVTGTYRVIWTGVLSAFDANKEGFGPELAVEERVSGPITIEVP